MQIKNKKNPIVICLICLFLFITNLSAEEFDITAEEIVINKDNKSIVGKGSVKVQDSTGKVIYGDKVVYEREREFVLIEGNVKITDNQ